MKVPTSQSNKIQVREHCPHCGTRGVSFDVERRNIDDWLFTLLRCAICGEPVIKLGRFKTSTQGEPAGDPDFLLEIRDGRPSVSTHGEMDGDEFVAYPDVVADALRFPNAPNEIYRYYLDGCKVWAISLRLSGASFRVCLELMLKKLGYKRGDLNQKIDDFLADKNRHVPSEIRDSLHDLRKAGNLSAHPITDIVGDVIEIEEEELLVCKTILEMMFDEYFEQPARRAAMKQSVGKKLKR